MMTLAPSRLRSAIAGAALLSACSPVPDLGPAPDLRSVGSIAADRTLAPATAAAAAWPATQWWTAYGDPQLSRLIEEGLAGAPDLRAAAARLRAAGGYVQQAGAARLPTLDARGTVGVAKQSYNNGIPAEFLPRGWQDTGQVAASLNFDLDLWGRNRAALAAQVSEEQAARIEVAQAALVLSTNIAAAYADLASLGALRRVQQSAFEVRSRTETLVSQRVASGLDTQAERRQALAAVPSARADIAATDEQIGLTRNRIAALLGQGPDRGTAIAVPQAPVLAQGLPADVTTALIGRRPDVAAARARAEAAASRIKVARADFYPALNLSALVGLQSLGLNRLIESDSTYGNAGPALSLPIFRGGELQGRYRTRRAEYDEAVANYDRTVVDAYREVADAVTSRRSLAVRLDDTRRALADSEAAYAIAQQRFRGGLSSFIDVLSAEDRVLVARRSAADLEARAFTLDVALVRALGGGFNDRGTAALTGNNGNG